MELKEGLPIGQIIPPGEDLGEELLELGKIGLRLQQRGIPDGENFSLFRELLKILNHFLVWLDPVAEQQSRIKWNTL